MLSQQLGVFENHGCFFLKILHDLKGRKQCSLFILILINLKSTIRYIEASFLPIAKVSIQVLLSLGAQQSLPK